MKKGLLFLSVMLFAMATAFGQGNIKGKVTDKSSGEGLASVNIQIAGQNQGSVSSPDGAYEIDVPAGTWHLEFSFVGYESLHQTVIVREGKSININAAMLPTQLNMEEVVITASRNPEYRSDVAGRIDVITSKEIATLPAQSTDDLLLRTSGVNVDRSSGIFSKSVVGIRGITGGEQGRVLVLQNGVPINKSDGGSVNWNRISVKDIEKVEVFKGPGSSIYGSNAMGGVINIITKKEDKKGVHGSAGVEYGTYNTLGENIFLGGRLKEGNEGFYWKLAAFNRSSDGYISVPDSLVESTTVKTSLEELNINAIAGYDFNENNSLELEYNLYDDSRGMGEKIQEEQKRDKDTHFAKASWKGQKGIFNWTLSGYYQYENYKDIREKGGKSYTRWDVDSKRKEMGTLLNFNAHINKHEIIFGGDLRIGSVDGADVYLTSTDIVRNIGDMNNYAVFMQDKISFSDHLKLTLGLRYDLVNFHDGEFRIDGMTNETSFMEDFTGPLEDHSWGSFTPKAALHYYFNSGINTYVSYSRGFRAATLDDLCRSGFICGGFKKANPELGPETVNNFEWGLNANIKNKLTILPSIYYMQGQDFMYYLTTGEFIFGGKKPVFKKENITNVKIYGLDLDLKYKVNEKLFFNANYTFTHSEIKEFDENPELEGKTLTHTPGNAVNAGFTWQNRYLNLAINYHYQDSHFLDDLNETELDGFSTIDAKIWKEVSFSKDRKLPSIELGINGSNLFDEVYLVGYDQINVGRFITGFVNFNF